jgi:hypothetical protein
MVVGAANHTDRPKLEMSQTKLGHRMAGSLHQERPRRVRPTGGFALNYLRLRDGPFDSFALLQSLRAGSVSKEGIFYCLPGKVWGTHAVVRAGKEESQGRANRPCERLICRSCLGWVFAERVLAIR